MNQHHDLWVDKYRPTSISDYVFYDQKHKTLVNQMIQDGSIPHLLLSGVQGTGKTTLAQLLVAELQIEELDVLTINASDENNVDTIRYMIKSFAETCAVGTFKIICLEEADYISLAGQAVLRRVMEESSDNARFILTCNYENKILPAIKSRCQQFHFLKHDFDDIVERVAEILLQEKIEFNLPLLDKYVRVGYPDIRKIINTVQLNSRTRTLLPITQNSDSSDYKFELLSLLENNDWKSARIIVCSQVSSGEWDDLYRFLYENIEKVPKFQDQNKHDDALIIIADYLFKHGVVSDPEINAAAMFIRLSQV